MDQKIEDQLKDAEKAGYTRGVSDKGKISLIHKALAAVQSECGAAGKSGKNDYDNYSYAMLIDYIEVIREPMAKNGLSVTFSVTKIERLADRTTRQGAVERVVQIELTGTLRHESGEFLDFVSYGEGQDRSDKAIYKAITGCKKYLLANIFNIPTTDDPEGSSDHERDGMNQDPKGTPPKAQGAARPPRATQPPPKAVPPAEAPVTQPQAQNPPAMTDAERTAAGLINQTQFEELKKLLKDKGISPAKWKVYLPTVAAGVTGISEIKTVDYDRIRDIVAKHPEEIMNYGKPPVPER